MPQDYRIENKLRKELDTRKDLMLKMSEKILSLEKQIELIKTCHDVSDISEILCDGCKNTLQTRSQTE